MNAAEFISSTTSIFLGAAVEVLGNVGAAAVAGISALAAVGSHTRNSLPFPGPALLASIRPPCSSTSFLASARPRPIPPRARPSDDSTCANISKICGSISAGIPNRCPEPITARRRLFAGRSARFDLRGGVYFAALVSRLPRT